VYEVRRNSELAKHQNQFLAKKMSSQEKITDEKTEFNIQDDASSDQFYSATASAYIPMSHQQSES